MKIDMRKLLIAVGCIFAIAQAYAAQPLLNLQLGYPRIFVNSLINQGAIYDGATVEMTSTPLTVTFAAGAIPGFVSGGTMTITADIDSAGSLTGGAITISGMVEDPATNILYPNPLLEGTVVNYGIADFGVTDRIELEMTATGGSLAPLAGGQNFGAVLALEGSTFVTDFSTTWTASVVKGDIGPIVPPPVGSGCTHTIGYWKTHPDAWPVQSVDLGGVSYTKATAISILKAPVRGDKSLSLAKQLIAAKLSVADGADSACIADVIDAADLWLSEHGGVGSSQKKWDGGDDLHDDLDSYNNGELCVAHCD